MSFVWLASFDSPRQSRSISHALAQISPDLDPLTGVPVFYFELDPNEVTDADLSLFPSGIP